MPVTAVKFVCGGDVRRRTIAEGSFTFDQLLSQCHEAFPASRRGLAVTYKDDEGDSITIACQADLKEALITTTALGKSTLRVEISLVASAAGDESKEAPPPYAELTQRGMLPPPSSVSALSSVASILLPIVSQPKNLRVVRQILGESPAKELVERARVEEPRLVLQHAFKSGAALTVLLQLVGQIPEVAEHLFTLMPCVGTSGPVVSELSTSSSEVAEVLSQLTALRFQLESTQSAPESSATAVHTGYTCDGCGASPITGIRYKCAVCKDYDLCSSCETAGKHGSAHPFLQLKSTSQVPSAIVTVLEPASERSSNWRADPVRVYQCPAKRRADPTAAEPKTSTAASALDFAASVASKAATAACAAATTVGTALRNATETQEQKDLRCAIEASLQVPAPRQPIAAAGAAPPAGVASTAPQCPPESALAPPIPTGRSATQYHARIVGVSDPDGRTHMDAGRAFQKSWTLRNEGSVPWEGCKLVHVGAHRLGAESTAVEVPLTPVGEQASLAVRMVAPSEPARYVSYWRLVTAEGVRFGHRVWVDITVTGEPAAAQTEPPSPAEPASPIELLASVESPSADPTAPTPSEAEEPGWVCVSDESATPQAMFGPQLEEVTRMGFGEEAAAAALVATGGEVQRAVALLLQQP